MLIHCDYCGSAFDPEKNATCPSCGAAWAGDQEAARVKAQEEQKAKMEQEAAEAEKFAIAADAVRRTFDSANRAAGGWIRLFHIVFWLIFGAGILFFFFILARMFFRF